MKLIISSPTAEDLRKAIQKYFYVKNDSVSLDANGAVSRFNAKEGMRQNYDGFKWEAKKGRFRFGSV